MVTSVIGALVELATLALAAYQLVPRRRTSEASPSGPSVSTPTALGGIQQEAHGCESHAVDHWHVGGRLGKMGGGVSGQEVVMHWGDMGWGWGWGALIWVIFMLVVLTGIAAVIIYAVRQPSGPRSQSAEQILAERYARGEIDEEEYQQRRRTLRG